LIVLPNKDTIYHLNINELSKIYPIKFQQYNGFVGHYPDSVLGNFVVRFKGYEGKVGTDILSEQTINNLMNESVSEIIFGKIPVSKISYLELIDYLKSKYPDVILKYIQNESTNKIVQLYEKKTNKIICTIM
jgi:hypothetical protein